MYISDEHARSVLRNKLKRSGPAAAESTKSVDLHSCTAFQGCADNPDYAAGENILLFFHLDAFFVRTGSVPDWGVTSN